MFDSLLLTRFAELKKSKAILFIYLFIYYFHNKDYTSITSVSYTHLTLPTSDLV